MKSNGSSLRIFWFECIILDNALSKTTEIEILNGLSNLGHKVEFIAIGSNRQITQNEAVQLTLIPLKSFKIVTPLLFTLASSFHIALRTIFSKVDFIITEPGANILGLIPILPLFHFKKTKLILDIRSPPITFGLTGILENSFFSLSILLAKKLSDGITIITKAMRDEICNKYNINKSFVGVWSSGVNTSLFDINKQFTPISFKKELNLDKKFVIMYHGTFACDRGLQETINAMALLSPSYPDIVLFLLGDGSFTKEMKRIIEYSSLSNCVIIHEAVEYSQVPKYIAMSDVGIVPLPNYPKWLFQCPLKLLEYLSMQKPVILTNIPAHTEVVGNESCGIYLTSTDPKVIEQAIVFAYENRDKLAEWGKTGKIIVNKEYSWEKVSIALSNYLFKIAY